MRHHWRKKLQDFSLPQELRERGTEKVHEEQQATKDKERQRQEQQEWMDRWAEANRDEIKDELNILLEALSGV